MNEKKYISLPLAEKIAGAADEKNVKLPESEYVHAFVQTDPEAFKLIHKKSANHTLEESLYFPAYDTFELFEMLPKKLKKIKSDWLWDFGVERNQKNGKYHCSYVELCADLKDEKSIIDCLGQMLLFLLKDDLYK